MSTASQDLSKTKKVKETSLLSQGLIGLSWALLFFFLGSYLITESWTWGYRGKWSNINTYIPVKTNPFYRSCLVSDIKKKKKKIA